MNALISCYFYCKISCQVLSIMLFSVPQEKKHSTKKKCDFLEELGGLLLSENNCSMFFLVAWKLTAKFNAQSL